MTTGPNTGVEVSVPGRQDIILPIRSAYLIDFEYALLPGEYRVRKRQTQLILRWP